ncbi:MAG TPA: hypothetical protein K8V15_10600 [Tessaracoccus flavescens]|uniref:Uncharacterized protein n=1 Tax=Tessaracoccus flavescens TaxID=399497 RepID=A0A921JRP7_9ACTN|nr:hypothetical protein [Tessaracoccus flavescens]
MSDREPESTEPSETAPPTVEKKSFEQPAKTRRMLWAVGIGVGGYMVLRGLYGVITGDLGQP